MSGVIFGPDDDEAEPTDESDEVDPPTAEQAAYARSWGWDI